MRNADIESLCFLVARVPGHRSRYSGFDFRFYQIFWEVVALERGSLRLVSTVEELLGTNISSCGLEVREYGWGDPSRWPRGTHYLQKLALTWLTCGGHSVGTVCSRTKAAGILSCVTYTPQVCCVWEVYRGVSLCILNNSRIYSCLLPGMGRT
jgi:hypothetical protein